MFFLFVFLLDVRRRVRSWIGFQPRCTLFPIGVCSDTAIDWLEFMTEVKSSNRERPGICEEPQAWNKKDFGKIKGQEFEREGLKVLARRNRARER